MAIAPVRPALKAVLVAAVWLVFTAAYFQQWAIPQSGIVVSSLLWFAAIVASANGYGDWIAKRALPADATTLEILVFSTAAGLGVIASLMTVLGAFGGWYPSGAITLLFVGLFLEVLTFSRHWLQRVLLHRPPLAPALLIAGALSLILVFAFAPVVYYDSLTYHLAMPAAYVQAHRWVPLTTLIYSAFPQNLEMLWTFCLLLQGDTLANLIGAGLALLLLGAIVGFASRYLHEESGWRGAALLAAMPAFVLLATNGYVDVGLAAYTFLSLYALFLWRDSGNPWAAAAAGLFVGWAVGIKYTAGICAVTGVVYLAMAQRPFRLTAFMRDAAAYAASATLVFLPWAIKNLVYVGNPVFPFFREFGIAQKNPWVGQAAEGYFRGLVEYEPRSPFEIVNVLWAVATKGLDFGRGMDVLGDFGWAPLVALLPALWFCRRSSVLRWLGVYCVLYMIPWALTRPVLRFMFPLAPVLALLAGHAWAELRSVSVPWFARAGRALVTALLVSGVTLLGYVTILLGLLRVPLGVQSKEEFLTQRLDYYAAAQFVNREPSVTKVFVVGDQRGYYYNKPALITPVFNRNPLVDWAESSANAADLKSKLAAQGISHLLINRTEMARLTPYNIFPFSDRAAAVWNDLRKSLAKPVYTDRACEVLAL